METFKMTTTIIGDDRVSSCRDHSLKDFPGAGLGKLSIIWYRNAQNFVR